METVRVGMREFRENMATYVLDAEAPVAITRHGDTIGYFVPTRKKQRTEAERLALREAADKMQEMMAEQGVTEEEMMEDFKRLRAAGRLRAAHK